MEKDRPCDDEHYCIRQDILADLMLGLQGSIPMRKRNAKPFRTLRLKSHMFQNQLKLSIK